MTYYVIHPVSVTRFPSVHIIGVIIGVHRRSSRAERPVWGCKNQQYELAYNFELYTIIIIIIVIITITIITITINII